MIRKSENKSRLQRLMLLLVWTAVWCFVFAADGKAQPQGSVEPLFVVWDGRGKEGFIDARGQTVIAPQFDDVTGFREGMAAVQVGKKWGFIDRTGKLVVAPRWKEVSAFSDGVAAVVDGRHGYAYTPLPEEGDGFEIVVKACGYIDQTGRYLIEPSIERKLTYCPDFTDGLAPVNFETELGIFFKDFPLVGRGGYMDKCGQWAIKPQFEGAFSFTEGLALVRSRYYHETANDAGLNDFAYIDTTGKVIFELKGYYQAHGFSEGLAQVNQESGKIGFVDRTGKLRFGVQAISVGQFSNGRAVAHDTETKLYGYIDQSGQWVIQPKYLKATPFAGGSAVVSVAADRCAEINPQGKVLSEWLGECLPGELVLDMLHVRTISERPNFRNIYGYKNRAGKYVWVSPGGEHALTQKWWRENYVGPHPPSFSR